MSGTVGNKRVYVKTDMFEGWATIVGVENCAFYPLVIELDDGDSDGHCYKRIDKNEIHVPPSD